MLTITHNLPENMKFIETDVAICQNRKTEKIWDISQIVKKRLKKQKNTFQTWTGVIIAQRNVIQDSSFYECSICFLIIFRDRPVNLIIAIADLPAFFISFYLNQQLSSFSFLYVQ